MINKHERDKSLDFLDNFVNSYNNLSDADIDSLFETYKNDKADGFEACVNNEYDFIINNLNETKNEIQKLKNNFQISCSYQLL